MYRGKTLLYPPKIPHHCPVSTCVHWLAMVIRCALVEQETKSIVCVALQINFLPGKQEIHV